MIMALLALLFAAIIQFGLIIHVRNTMIDAASAGARYGALGDRTAEDGAARTRELLAGSVPNGSTAHVQAAVVGESAPMVTVTVSSAMPMVGFVTGPVQLEVTGHAYRYD